MQSFNNDAQGPKNIRAAKRLGWRAVLVGHLRRVLAKLRTTCGCEYLHEDIAS